MLEVIADTSRLQYLYQIGHLDILAALYGHISVPESVAEELARGQSLGISLPAVRQIEWITVRNPQTPVTLRLPSGLGKGEADVLALANETRSALAVLDDRRARRFARVVGVTYTGTLGILLKANRAGVVVAIEPLVEQLDGLGFRLKPETREGILRLAREQG